MNIDNQKTKKKFAIFSQSNTFVVVVVVGVNH